MKAEKNIMKMVKCINERTTYPGQITVGSRYWMDECSIWTDLDGDEYATFYTYHIPSETYKLGQFKTSHFKIETAQYTMRSAFKRWLILHDEEWRLNNRIRIPNWFRHYIRQNKQWSYTVSNCDTNYYCNTHEMDYNDRRRFKGYYTFEISDEELYNLQRAKWIK